MTISSESKPRYRVTAAKIIPAIELWPHRQDLADRSIMTCKSDGDCPIRGIPDGNPIRTSLIVAGSIAEGFVETLNSVYILHRTPAQVLRLAIDSGAYTAVAKDPDSGLLGNSRPIFMCHGIDEMKSKGILSDREHAETKFAVKALVQRYNDKAGTSWTTLSNAMGACGLRRSNADCLKVYEDYINELSATGSSEDQS